MISHCTDVKAPTLKFEKRCSLLVKAHTPAGTLENDRREQQQRTTTENNNRERQQRTTTEPLNVTRRTRPCPRRRRDVSCLETTWLHRTYLRSACRCVLFSRLGSGWTIRGPRYLNPAVVRQPTNMRSSPRLLSKVLCARS